MSANTLPQTFTYFEYLNCDRALVEQPYELVVGKVVEMPPESPINVAIALRLMFCLLRLSASSEYPIKLK